MFSVLYVFRFTCGTNSAHPMLYMLITIYAPVIYTRPCIMFWRRGYTLRGEVGGGWALEFPSFLGPVKWHRADRRVPFGAPRSDITNRNDVNKRRGAEGAAAATEELQGLHQQ
jgi:hypothetical protein